MNTRLVVLVALVLVASVCKGVTPVALTTPAGVCTFNADAFTATPPAARGQFGPGCPGYVPPVVTPPVTPGACPPAVLGQRQASVNTGIKVGGKMVQTLFTTADQVYSIDAKTVAPFPWFGNRGPFLSVNSNQVLALPIAVPATLSTTFAARVGFFDTPGAGGIFPAGNGASYSISLCPGDFTVPAACKAQWNGQDGEYLTFGAPELLSKNPGICPIQRSKVYYLNIITATLAAPTASKCAGACTVPMAYYFLQP